MLQYISKLFPVLGRKFHGEEDAVQNIYGEDLARMLVLQNFHALVPLTDWHVSYLVLDDDGPDSPIALRCETEELVAMTASTMEFISIDQDGVADLFQEQPGVVTLFWRTGMPIDGDTTLLADYATVERFLVGRRTEQLEKTFGSVPQPPVS